MEIARVNASNHSKYLLQISLSLLAFIFQSKLIAQQTLLIHTRGVWQSNVSLLPLAGAAPFKSIATASTSATNPTVILNPDPEFLPGEFVLRFDYKENESSTPYPSEKRIFISNRNVELWINPKFSNNSDSTWFSKDETENNSFAFFSKQNAERRDKLSLLQNFLVNYDDTKSKFYQQAIIEYEQRRKQYNQWVKLQAEKDKSNFASHTYPFQYVQAVTWSGTETMRNESIKAHYFDLLDFNDSLIVNTSNLKEWMNGYVNLYGAGATSVAVRDSLFTLAGTRAITKAKQGHPKVYGWMVDYFYNGFESYGINSGIEMLQQYLNDPRCLTAKRTAILKRLEGISTLVPGALAPDFLIGDSSGNYANFHSLHNKKYKLVLFWSASCSHCTELVTSLNKWYHEKGSGETDIVAISVDETPEEIQTWKNAILPLKDWIHSRPDGGVNSKEAKAYFILSTPFMILVESNSNKILALPRAAEELFSQL